ncbi:MULTISPECIES: bifunctional adenosylcobinamide kinase/adenosylcobinamide-phosphate guanylyltransferase [Prochlorococcus]|uniref:Adenosylcobinamide kinase n=1 Tax=Prochlorococcus marinus (strain SARG / CCMP1375 / SS120) TaxID=167539 RepID=Q7VBW8_PROMA|nr:MULTISPECIES: bifunctional adenosylcobinamide kinase/adenosylcobinamide-phosphate guanylyltransferase [Prochlorococcus]AAQ00019.1 Adenosyl cobinamide kinase/adenosyl cobinamide phosphate guanylyltransferase [Prochlorococcus marinus subsp. marinus str. CCMP1375]KGG13814.1 Adenosylcobinamide-phosphate guanylyltransferase [Prochlorococcus marinus str. LG]KGG18949.1 Adenosylcobinamide-phosphate guanylyltransferase [Prochlorococcus marinus str. SS2]KGG23513.1 Adenosylcobinamide-phosphate guanylyl
MINKRNKNNLILVSGPIKSGKSRWAEKLIFKEKNVTYIATHEVIYDNKDWIERIRLHKQRRPSHWQLIETSDISSSLKSIDKGNSILIDSLGGVVSKYLNYDSVKWNTYSSLIIEKLTKFEGVIVIVAEEIGWGVSPYTESGNIFRDRLSELTEKLDTYAKQSWLVIHGRAINISINSSRI